MPTHHLLSFDELDTWKVLRRNIQRFANVLFFFSSVGIRYPSGDPI